LKKNLKKKNYLKKDNDEKIDLAKFESTILTNNEKLLLLQWIPINLQNKKWTLLLRASRDGYTVQAFHNKCNNKAPTIVIIHSNNNHVFGGFTPISWDSSNTSKVEDTKASFLFLLRSQRGDQPNKFSLKSTANCHIYCHQSYGPTFGGGFDFNICENCGTTNSSYSNFGHTYDHANDKDKLAGAYNFTVKDYEVYVLE